MMKRILVTAFEPFHQHTVNTSMLILARLPHEIVPYHVTKQVLPVIYKTAFEQLETTLDNQQFDAICLLGLAENRPHITAEYLALNIQHSTLPDNQNNLPNHDPIITNGPTTLQSNIDLKTHLTNNPYNIQISYHAGTFVCNELYYRTLYRFKDTINAPKICFIHVPYHHETQPINPINTLTQAIEFIIKTVF